MGIPPVNGKKQKCSKNLAGPIEEILLKSYTLQESDYAFNRTYIIATYHAVQYALILLMLRE